MIKVDSANHVQNIFSIQNFRISEVQINQELPEFGRKVPVSFDSASIVIYSVAIKYILKSDQGNVTPRTSPRNRHCSEQYGAAQ